MELKPKEGQVRLVFTDNPDTCPAVKENPGAIFAVIGPFISPSDKEALQVALTMLLRGWNVQP